jgi:hypothetical protein
MSIEICKNLETECTNEIVPCSEDNTTSVPVNPLGLVIEANNPRVFVEPTWITRADAFYAITYQDNYQFKTPKNSILPKMSKRYTNGPCYIDLVISLPYFILWMTYGGSSVISEVSVYGQFLDDKLTSQFDLSKNFSISTTNTLKNPLIINCQRSIRLEAPEKYLDKTFILYFHVFLQKPRKLIESPLYIAFPAIKLA